MRVAEPVFLEIMSAIMYMLDCFGRLVKGKIYPCLHAPRLLLRALYRRCYYLLIGVRVIHGRREYAMQRFETATSDRKIKATGAELGVSRDPSFKPQCRASCAKMPGHMNSSKER